MECSELNCTITINPNLSQHYYNYATSIFLRDHYNLREYTYFGGCLEGDPRTVSL